MKNKFDSFEMAMLIKEIYSSTNNGYKDNRSQ